MDTKTVLLAPATGQGAIKEAAGKVTGDAG